MMIFIDVLDTSSCSLCGMRSHVTSNHGNISFCIPPYHNYLRMQILPRMLAEDFLMPICNCFVC